MTKRLEFRPSVREEIIARATRCSIVYCEAEGCGNPCKKFHIDHIRPDGLSVDKSKALTAKEGQLLCLPCHAEKTATDVPRIKKAQKVARKHVGAIPSGQSIPNRPFPTWEKPRKPSRPAVPRRDIFKEG